MALIKEHKGFLISAAISLLGFFPLMGAPGFALISTFQAILALATGAPYDASYGDDTWPMAIMYAIVAPWVVFLTYQGLKRLNSSFRGKRALLFALLISFLALFVFHAIFCNPEKMRTEREARYKEFINSYSE